MAEETKIGIKLEEETKPIKKMCEKLMDSINYELDKGIENVDTKELGEAIDMIKDLYEAKEKMVKACYYKQIMEAMEEHDFEDEEEIMDEGRRGYRGQPRSESGRFMSLGDGRRSNRGRGGRRGYESPMMMYDDWDEMRRMSDFEDGRMYYGGSGSSSSGGGSSMGGSRGGSSSGGSGMSGGSSSGMSGGSSGGSSGGGGGSRGYSEGNGGNMSSRMQRDGREGRSGESRRGYMESKEMGKDKSEKMRELETYMKDLGEDMSEMISGMSPEEKALMKNKLSGLMTKIQ